MRVEDREASAKGAGAPILVADPIKLDRELAKALLSQLDIDVSEAASDVEAIAAAKRERFDLILLDMETPTVNGLTTVRAIRSASRLNATTPILAVNACAGDRDNAWKDAGIDDYLEEPLTASVLIKQVFLWTSQTDDSHQGREGLSAPG
jgi:CheY-like chemotaxis protein